MDLLHRRELLTQTIGGAGKKKRAVVMDRKSVMRFAPNGTPCPGKSRLFGWAGKLEKFDGHLLRFSLTCLAGLQYDRPC